MNHSKHRANVATFEPRMDRGMSMSNPNSELPELLVLVVRFRYFLEILEAATAADQRPAASWLRRVLVEREWHAWSALLGGAEAAVPSTLIDAGKGLAARCRSTQPFSIWGLVGLGRANDKEQLLAAVADHLDQLGTLLNRLASIEKWISVVDVCLEQWKISDRHLTVLAALADRLPAELLERIGKTIDLDARLAHWADQVGQSGDPALLPLQIEALALIGLLTEYSNDSAQRIESHWVDAWLLSFGLVARFTGVAAAATRGLRITVDCHLEWSVLAGSIMAEWTRLPEPPSWPGPTGELLNCPVLQAQWSQTKAVAFSADTFTELDAENRRTFAAWVLQSSGRLWFDRLLRESQEQPTSAARAWWTALRATAWCRSFPDCDPATGRVAWPNDTPFAWPSVEVVYDEAPIGSVLAVARYSPDPEGSQCRLSKGSAQPDATADPFADVIAAMRLADMDVRLADDLSERAKAFAAAGPDTQALAEALALAGLDVVAQTAAMPAPTEKSETRIIALDQLLTVLRDWAESHGLIVLPQQWSFRARGQKDQFDEKQGKVQLYYRTNDPTGAIFHIRQFGLQAGGKCLREAVVSVSVGPAPAGLSEIEELLRPADLNGAEPIRDRLRGWRLASLDGYFPAAAVQTYVDYYGPLGDELRARHPHVAGRFADYLAYLLENQLKLTLFTPAFLHEYPQGWLQLIPGKRVMTGRVRAVHRPGLKDAHGTLRIPALVEVD